MDKATEKSRSAMVVWTIGTAICAAILSSAVGIMSAAHESDVVSAQRQARSARHAIDTSIDDLALQQESVAVWDDAAAHVVADRRDMSWIHDNIGSWLHRLFLHSEVFILNEKNRPIYAALNGNSAHPSRYALLQPTLKSLVRSVRDGGRPNGKHDRNPGQPLHPANTVRTTLRATHDSHLMLVDGRPAVASAMLIQPSSHGYVRPRGKWPILISVRYLDGAFLRELEERQLIAAPRLSISRKILPDEHLITLRSEGGRGIAYLIWKPELPGTKIANRLIPWSVLVLIVVGLLFFFMARRLRGALRDAAAAANESRHHAMHDALTGLVNRSVLQGRLEELCFCSGTGHRYALVLVDVDDFKLTNDTLGHDAGDALLQAFASRLAQFAPKGSIVARLGGDEFAVLLTDLRQDHSIEEFLQRLVDLLSRPVPHHNTVIDSRASVGATMCEGPRSASEVLKEADLALYASKAGGRGTFRTYSRNMSFSMRARQKMLNAAKAALDNDLIEPFYQPKVRLQTGQVIGFEALLRFRTHGKALMGPKRIAAAFEDSALAVQLGERMRTRVVHDLARWRAAGAKFGHVAVNVTAADLGQPQFAHRLTQQLADAGLEPADLQVEITETVLLSRTAIKVGRALRELHERGVRIALDDFGTGYASLSHLKQFPVDVIKIDRAFVRNLHADAHDGAIVQALINLAEVFGIEVVAEGVETEAQRDLLKALGCTSAQGYLFGRPQAASRVQNMLAYYGAQDAA